LPLFFLLKFDNQPSRTVTAFCGVNVGDLQVLDIFGIAPMGGEVILIPVKPGFFFATLGIKYFYFDVALEGGYVGQVVECHNYLLSPEQAKLFVGFGGFGVVRVSLQDSIDNVTEFIVGVTDNGWARATTNFSAVISSLVVVVIPASTEIIVIAERIIACVDSQSVGVSLYFDLLLVGGGTWVDVVQACDIQLE
jgi:hypothetical protein